MAVLDQDLPRGESLLSRIAKRLYGAMESIAEANARSSEVRYYQNLSDTQLAELGLTRDRIVQHVFRDKLC